MRERHVSQTITLTVDETYKGVAVKSFELFHTGSADQ